MQTSVPSILAALLMCIHCSNFSLVAGPKIKRISVSDSNVELDIEVNKGLPYSVDHSNDLVTWQSLGTPTAQSENETVELIEVVESPDFFRISQEVPLDQSFFTGTIVRHDLEEGTPLGCLKDDDGFYILGDPERIDSEWFYTFMVKFLENGSQERIDLTPVIPGRSLTNSKTKYSGIAGFSLIQRDPNILWIIEKTGITSKVELNFNDFGWTQFYTPLSFPEGIVIQLVNTLLDLQPAEYGFYVRLWNGDEGILSFKKAEENGEYFQWFEENNIELLNGSLFLGGTLFHNFDEPSVTESGACVKKIDINSKVITTHLVLDLQNDSEFVWALFRLGGGLACLGRQSSQSSTQGKNHGLDAFWLKFDADGVVEWLDYTGFESFTFQPDSFLQTGDGDAILFDGYNDLQVYVTDGGQVSLSSLRIGNKKVQIDGSNSVWFWTPSGGEVYSLNRD